MTTGNAAEIAEITREPGTNTFHIQKEGTVHIDYGQQLVERDCAEGETGYCEFLRGMACK